LRPLPCNYNVIQSVSFHGGNTGSNPVGDANNQPLANPLQNFVRPLTSISFGACFFRFYRATSHNSALRISLGFANNRHDRNGLRRRKCHVIEGTGLAFVPRHCLQCDRRCGVAGELSCSQIETLPYRLKILRRNLPFEPKQFSSLSILLTLRPSDSRRKRYRQSLNSSLCTPPSFVCFVLTTAESKR
jgi:hypothetical protein